MFYPRVHSGRLPHHALFHGHSLDPPPIGMSVQGCLTCDLGVKENLLVCCPGNRFALYRDLDIKVVLPIIEHSQICTVMKIKTLNITGIVKYKLRLYRVID